MFLLNRFTDKVDTPSLTVMNTKRLESKQDTAHKEYRCNEEENNRRNKKDEDNGMPLLWNQNRTNKSPSNDAELLSENNRQAKNKKEFTRKNSLTNDNVIKDYLLNQEKIHKPENNSDSSFVANSKKLDKFKSYLKRTFQTEENNINSPTLERPNKLSKLDTSSSPLVKSDTEKEENNFIITNEKTDEGQNSKHIFSSSSSNPTSPGTGQSSPKTSSNIAVPLKHRHHHPKKAIAAASSSTILPSKTSSSSNNAGIDSHTKESNATQEKEKKVSPESSTPSSPSNGTPSKSNNINNKKKQKSK